LENAGLLAMLQRGASKLIWLINTDVPLGDQDHCNEEVTSSNAWPIGQMTNQLYDKFGFGTDSAAGYLSHNKVFPPGDLAIVACSLQTKKKHGKPVVHKQEHALESNAWWGIRTGRTVEVLYVYNDKCKEFEALLPNATQNELPSAIRAIQSKASNSATAESTALAENMTFEHANNLAHSTMAMLGESLKGDGRFADFPNYKTTLQNIPEFTSLSTEQVNLLAALSEYGIMQNAAPVRELLGVLAVEE